MNRVCTLCKTEKSIEEFALKKSHKDGISPWCKNCKSIKDKANYEKSKLKRLEKAKSYYEINKDSILTRRKTDEKVKEYNKIYKKENKEYLRQYQNAYNHENKESIRQWRSLYNKTNRDNINQYNKKRSKDPLIKTIKNVRSRLLDFLNNKNLTKSKKFSEYIGCSKAELIQHLENQFKSGMTWENYGEVWHIDHSIPLSSATTENRVYELSHYKNLKPMFALDNLSKNNKADVCWQKLQRDKLIEEDRLLGYKFDLKASDFVLTKEDLTKEHIDFIKKYEWLGKIGFGVRWVFTARYNNQLAGVVMISEPNAYQFDIKLEALIQRGACSSWAPKNLNSRLVMFSCKWVTQNTSKRIFVAYSDIEAGEIGTIYQACNFDFLGFDYGARTNYILEDGRIVNARYFTRTSSIKRWAKELNIEWKDEWSKSNGFQDIKNIPSKIRTILNEYAKEKMNLCKKINKKPKGKYALLINLGKERLIKPWTPKPYPKRTIYNK